MSAQLCIQDLTAQMQVLKIDNEQNRRVLGDTKKVLDAKELRILELMASLSEQEARGMSLSHQLTDCRGRLKETTIRMERAQALTEEMQVRCAQSIVGLRQK